MLDLFFRYIKKQDIPEIVTVILLGSFNHFLYSWTGEAPLAALFTPVNESPWEHLKLLFFPFLFVSVWTFYRHFRKSRSFFFCRFLGVLSGLLFTLAAFYTYTGIIGRHFLAADLLIFCLSVLLSFFSARLSCHYLTHVPSANIVFCLWLSLALCFFVFTCFPPDLPLFFLYG